jgi:DNA segregation ATPase FtsK/SpoIIIE, S-DNA-T family
VEMDEVTIGPSVTRYAIKPAEGVKLSKIVALQDNLAYALAAHPIRIEAPIPGKSLVGIEIPNTTKTTVGLASLLADSKYEESEKPLLVSLGKGISGDAHFANLAKMPHVLIAGATGSGKSVTIHAIITSLLYRNSPELLKFIMIDPKRVELTLYNKIPHLLTPVITDPKKTILALKWAGKEMDRRYDLLEQHACKDIDSYHKNVLAPAREKKQEIESMPFIVVVIDELADIMMTYPRELESGIVRLAQMSRAVGIHLILSTQRPSVNVITGLIKANVPARVALQVVSQIDSRTIIDSPGAEKLLGSGDMLYLGGEMSKPVRIQSAFISETEVKKVVKYLIEAYQDEVPGDEINFAETATDRNVLFEGGIDEDMGDDDELYETAKDEVIKAGKASTSYIQRKLRVGYARAARLIDMLEERGVIGPGDGAKPREVISTGDAEVSEGLEKAADKLIDENGFEEPAEPKQF